MIQIGIHKDILNDYEEKIVGSLSLRKLIACSIAFPLAVAFSVVLVFVWGADAQAAAYVAAIIAVPIWYMGFMKPHGMKPEEYLDLWVNDRFGTHKITYKTAASDMYDARANERKKDAGKEKGNRSERRGCEWCNRPSSRANQRLRRAMWEERKAVERARAETLRASGGESGARQP